MFQKNIIWLMCLIKPYTIYGLTCNEVLELPENKKLTMYELQSLQAKDIVACLAHLSRERVSLPEAEFIWQSIIEYHEGVSNIPENVFMQLHWVTIAIKPEEYGNMTLSSIDVISNFGLNYNLNDGQLAAIADRIREDFAGKEPEDYTYIDLTALGQILCAFNRSEIERIHPLAYLGAAQMIGQLERCNFDVMKSFATLAVHKDAFGSPSNWTKSVLDIVGHVSDFLPKPIINKIKIDQEDKKISSK